MPQNAARIVVSLGLVFFGPCLAATAADDLLGLPAAREAGRPGAVMLHGGGRFSNDAFARFVELAGGRNARIVVVPSASYRQRTTDTPEKFRAAMNRRFGAWVRLRLNGRIAAIDFLHTDDPARADDSTFVRPLIRATGVWFSGGAQSRLNDRYVGPFPRRTLFQEAVRGVLERGGVVGGTSAGMAALPEVMTLHQVRHRPDGPLTVVAAHGLGLFNGAIVEQHFDGFGGRLERFTGLLRDPDRLDLLAGRTGAGERMLGLAVDGATALVLSGDQLETIGTGRAHVFIKAPGDGTLAWHTLDPGRKARLQRDPNGLVTLKAETAVPEAALSVRSQP